MEFYQNVFFFKPKGQAFYVARLMIVTLLLNKTHNRHIFLFYCENVPNTEVVI